MKCGIARYWKKIAYCSILFFIYLIVNNFFILNDKLESISNFNNENILRQEINEYVLDPNSDNILSHLKWLSYNYNVYKLNLFNNINSDKRLSSKLLFNFDNKYNGYLIDKDWIYYRENNKKNNYFNNDNWTHLSSHKTKNKFKSLDLNFKQLVFNSDNFNIYKTIGFLYKQNNLMAYGGNYIYTIYDNMGNIKDFRGDKGNWPNDSKGMKYIQNFFIPYFGYIIQYNLYNFYIKLILNSSNTNVAITKDLHFDQQMLTMAKYENVSFKDNILIFKYPFSFLSKIEIKLYYNDVHYKKTKIGFSKTSSIIINGIYAKINEALKNNDISMIIKLFIFNKNILN